MNSSQITTYVIIGVAVICIVYLLLLGLLNTVQLDLLYPGRYRECTELGEPWQKISNSYYKKGTTKDLWVVLGGNNSVPTDYVKFTIGSDHNFILIGYPGYCLEGGKGPSHPDPTNTAKEIKTSLDKFKDTNTNTNTNTINFVCYSIGTGVGLNFLSNHPEYQVKKVVLIAPFWSIEDIVWDKCFIPNSIINYFLVHSWDNHANIIKLPDIIDLTLVHGKNDILITSEHSERLFELIKHRKNAKLILTEDDDHLSVCRLIPDLIK